MFFLHPVNGYNIIQSLSINSNIELSFPQVFERKSGLFNMFRMPDC